jgi:hypothetical protein
MRHPDARKTRDAVITTLVWALGVGMCPIAVAQQTKAEAASTNAADCYRRVDEMLSRLPTHDKALIESTCQLKLMALYAPASSWSSDELVKFSSIVPVDKAAQETVKRLKPALDLFRKGAQMAECNWEFDFSSGNLSTPIPHLAIVTDLVGVPFFKQGISGRRDRSARRSHTCSR